MAVSIVPLSAANRSEWRRLFDAYAAFYEVPMEEATVKATWSWLLDPMHVLEGVMARTEDGATAGLAHYHAMPSTLKGADIGFLDDLYVDLGLRGLGIGEALIGHVAAIGRQRGWSRIRWITAEDNRRAQALYDRVATGSRRLVYELAP